MEEIYDLLHLHRKKLKTAFFKVHADILPICTRLHGFSFSNQSQAFDPNFLCFSILRSIHLFLGRKPPDAIRRPGGESRCHNLSRKGQKSKPLYQGSFHQGFAHHFVLTRRVWSSFPLPWKPFWSVVYICYGAPCSIGATMAKRGFPSSYLKCCSTPQTIGTKLFECSGTNED